MSETRGASGRLFGLTATRAEIAFIVCLVAFVLTLAVLVLSITAPEKFDLLRGGARAPAAADAPADPQNPNVSMEVGRTPTKPSPPTSQQQDAKTTESTPAVASNSKPAAAAPVAATAASAGGNTKPDKTSPRKPRRGFYNTSQHKDAI